MTSSSLLNTKLKLLEETSLYRAWEKAGEEKIILEFLKPQPPLTVELEKPQRRLQWRIIDYIARSMEGSGDLIRFTLENRTLMKLAEYLFRYKSGSQSTLRNYVTVVYEFSNYLDKQPDTIVDYCLTSRGAVDSLKTHQLSLKLDEWLGELEAKGLAKSTLTMYTAEAKTFFRVNGIDLSLPHKYSIRPTYRVRAFKPEEVQRIIEVASPRDKAIIAMLATGGFRIGTLLKLRYEHVMEDLEAGRIPLHIHVDAQITKGKYADYDTFINDEAVKYLKLYLELRRKGTDKIPPEHIVPESPLFRAESNDVHPLSYAAFRTIFFRLLRKIGLRSGRKKRYSLNIHSLRKFFRTQLTALGVPTDYVEYMLGHKLSTYNDVQSKGVEFLRSVYSAANLRIFPGKKVGLADILKEIIRSRGEDPAKYLRSEVMAHRTIIGEREEVEVYARALWEMLRREVLDNVK